MASIFGKSIFAVASFVLCASAVAVTTDEVEAELIASGMPAGTTLWTDQRLKVDKFRKLNSFTKITVKGGRVQKQENCQRKFLCDSIIVDAELDSGETVVLDLGPSEAWRVGEYGTLKLAFNKNPPSKTYAKWGKRAIDAVANAQVYVGMTASQARMSWGPPSDTRTTQTKSVKHEQWIYGDPLNRASYLYLDNEKVTAVQQ